MNRRRIFFSSLILLETLLLASSLSSNWMNKPQTTADEKAGLLQLLAVTPSLESVDYIRHKTQFQLHSLLTEQRHPKTWNLSYELENDCENGLRLLFSVDDDISQKLEALSKEKDTLEQAAQAIEDSLLSGKKIYVYGCGSTGRLAKQMESTFWRPFWEKTKKTGRMRKKIERRLGKDIEDRLIGEMTGGDRALISSLEGFEDLQLIGRLQLEDRRVERGDVVICVTEGGETSSVIGTVLAALDQWKNADAYQPEKTKKYLYFICNNPEEILRPFDRSRKVLEEPGITKINLTTGPQAITGSTRMQATTIETFVVGNILQKAIDQTLRKFLTDKEMASLGFGDEVQLEEKLDEFPLILRQVKERLPALAKFTKCEAETYKKGNFSTYFAQKGLITVFIDSTERSPTFRLFPLDTIKEEKRKSWIQVWTPAATIDQGWKAFLGRPFRGLSRVFYEKPFEQEISDPYLKNAAVESLKKAGDDQQFLYDFSLDEFNLNTRGPSQGDLGVAVCLSPEEEKLGQKDSDIRKFIELFLKKGANIAIILVSEKSSDNAMKLIREIPEFGAEGKGIVVILHIDGKNDPLGLNKQIALKILLNAHSTAVMASLGKVIGNTMTNVSPSNLKLIGRATYLIQSHVNDVLSRPEWIRLYGAQKPISYEEANAVLFDAMSFVKDNVEADQTAEVALAIIRILESLRLKKSVSNENALSIVKNTGLSEYLSSVSSRAK